MKTVNVIDILGTQYRVIQDTEPDKNPKLTNALGYFEPCSKKLVISGIKEDDNTVENLDDLKDCVLRHEIMHAFLYESGLYESSDWAASEEMIDYFALQLPKIVLAMRAAEVL